MRWVMSSGKPKIQEQREDEKSCEEKKFKMCNENLSE